ncbi:hypothetical protein RLOC_00000620 [Lonchura striata]|uniref:Uncharacterized protein n=1 Tax=Lonchura striata TaxID=40157 RepID=A0A218VAF1_9PASE|nr:hypothetical protein RLOC_00000620 [Lonchura striata domestica]
MIQCHQKKSLIMPQSQLGLKRRLEIKRPIRRQKKTMRK